MIHIGPYAITNPLIVAPMAGVTDRPFRQLCKHFGAGHAVSEMMTSDQSLYAKQKSLRRANFDGELAPISAQIVGSDPKMMAKAAQTQLQHGAQIIDINMGCPAKKVCQKLAGSALLSDPHLVRAILTATVDAVDAPVTLKTRLGYAQDQENIMMIADMAQQAGIAAIAIHGRTRDQMYQGSARYDLIAQVKKQVRIPVIANGDIDSPQKAKWVLEYTGADAIMIGRAAQGKPWIFREIAHFLATGQLLAPPPVHEIRDVLLIHLERLYQFYGEYSGTRIARKHIAWYTSGLRGSCAFKQAMYGAETTALQAKITADFLTERCREGDLSMDMMNA